MSEVFDAAAIQARYQKGEWRGFVFRDLVIADIARLKKSRARVTTLDIGCGHGFDGHPDPQRAIAAQCDRLVGIEPDKAIEIPAFFHEKHYATLEGAPIAPESIDMAYAVMVLEHVDNPTAFIKKLYASMSPGAVFWGFTVDSRHWFSSASNLLARLKIKDKYLTSLHGARGDERYENYPVSYLFNTENDIRRYTAGFARTDIVSLWKRNQTSYYLPRGLHWFGNLLDGIWGLFGRRGSVLVIRLEK